MTQDGQDNSQRTYEPTSLRIAEARRRGHVAVSSDLTGGVVLIVAGIVLGMIAPAAGEAITEMLKGSLGSISNAAPGGELSFNYKPLWNLFFLFVMVIILVASAAGAVQTRGLWASQALQMDFERLSPSAGFVRIFANGGWVRFWLGLLKVAAVFVTAAIVIRISLSEAHMLLVASPSGMLTIAAKILGKMMLTIGVVLTACGVLDWIFARWRYRKSLMMTRREYLDDLKRMESNAARRIEKYRNN